MEHTNQEIFSYRYVLRDTELGEIEELTFPYNIGLKEKDILSLSIPFPSSYYSIYEIKTRIIDLESQQITYVILIESVSVD